MGSHLYVGNLGYGISDKDLKALFMTHGNVRSAQVVKDRASGHSKGFGFVEMSNPREAEAAISALNGREIEGRVIVVNKPRPKEAGNELRNKFSNEAFRSGQRY